MSVEERFNVRRDHYLATHSILPTSTPFDDDDARRELYLSSYRRAFLEASRFDGWDRLGGVYEPVGPRGADWRGFEAGRYAGFALGQSLLNEANSEYMTEVVAGRKKPATGARAKR